MDEKIVNIHETWSNENGLMTINLAAQVIGISQPAVSEATDKGKIKSFQYKKKRYLSYNSVLKYIAQRSEKAKKET